MNLKQLLIAGALGAFLMFLGCSSLTHSKNEEAVAKIKKIAVVAISVHEPKSATPHISFKNETTYADDIYADLSNSFAKNLHWQVLPAGSMKSNPKYIELYDKTMKGFQNKMPRGEHVLLMVADGVMDGDCLRIMGQEGRDALIKALGVDAIVTADIDVLLNGSSLMGFGNKYPQSSLSFWLYKAGVSSPEWFEGGIKGDESKISVGSAFFDQKILHQGVTASAKTAFAQIGAKKQ